MDLSDVFMEEWISWKKLLSVKPQTFNFKSLHFSF